MSYNSLALTRLFSGSLLTTLAIAACNFFTSVLLARICGPSILGEFVFQFASAQVAYALLSPGFDQSYIRQHKSRDSWAAAWVLTGVQVIFLLTFPLGVVFAAKELWPEALSHLSPGVFELLLATMGTLVFAELLLSPLAVRLEYGRVNRIRAASALGAATVSVGVALSAEAPSVVPFIAREITLALFMAMFGLAFSPKVEMRRPSAAELRAFLAYSGALWRLNILEKLSQRVEYILLGSLGSAAALGNYFALRSFFESIHGVIAKPIQTVLFSFLCRDGATAQRIVRDVARFVRAGGTALVIPLVGALAYFAAPLLQALFGAKFHFLPAGIAALAVASVLLIGFEILKILAMTRAVHQRLVRWRLAQLSTVVICLPLFVSVMGAQGAAFAFFASSLVLFAGSRRVFLSSCT